MRAGIVERGSCERGRRLIDGVVREGCQEDCARGSVKRDAKRECERGSAKRECERGSVREGV